MEPTQERDWLTQEEAAAFIGKNAPYYLENWKIHAETTLKGWNWAAAIFSIEWMAYRKMYREIMLSLLILIGIATVEVLIGLDGNWGSYGFRILIGLTGNALYRKKALRSLHKTNAQTDSQLLQALSQKGGVSVFSVVMMLLLEMVYAFFLFFILY